MGAGASREDRTGLRPRETKKERGEENGRIQETMAKMAYSERPDENQTTAMEEVGGQISVTGRRLGQ